MLNSNQVVLNKIKIGRYHNNPVLTPVDVKPSREDFVVKGIFNCGVTKFKGEYILLCRVAEAVSSSETDIVSFPVIAEENGESQFQSVCLHKSEHPELCFADSRTITIGNDGYSNVVYLTTLSHLRLARSSDGIHFKVDEKPVFMPDSKLESWGIEDPRIIHIGDIYYINYTAVSPYGAGTSMVTTRDFVNFERHGSIFLPENKDVIIFPEKIGGVYYAWNRPVPKAIGTPDIWISESEDMFHWGKHRHLYGVSDNGWESGRIGGGAPPVMTEKGWLKIYHAADQNNRYCLGVFLLDKMNPGKILAKSSVPLLEPEMEYEVNGFFGNVVFTCGCLLEEGKLIIYYGASDESICVAEILEEDVFRHLGI